MRDLRRAFVFADLSGFTALTEIHGDLDAASIAGRFETAVRATLSGGSRLVKTMGDAAMVVCDSAESALDVAVGIHHRADAEAHFPTVRIGVHVGPCVETKGDYFGGTVNVAARVAAHAQGGQILCTEEVHQEASSYHARLFSVGKHFFKNVREPVALYELGVHPREVCATALDPVCRMRVEHDSAPGRLVVDGRVHYFCSLSCAATFAADPGAFSGPPTSK